MVRTRRVFSGFSGMLAPNLFDIGLNCYLCERQNCAARAHAPINRKLAVNERERSLAIFQFHEK